jgi:hypothetical protein
MKEIMTTRFTVPVGRHFDRQLAQFGNLASDCYSAMYCRSAAHVSPYKHSGFLDSLKGHSHCLI